MANSQQPVKLVDPATGNHAAINSGGAVSVTLAAGGTKVSEFSNTGAIAVSTPTNVDSAPIGAALTGTLAQVVVHSEQPFSFNIQAGAAGGPTQVAGEMGANAGGTVIWDVPDDAITAAATEIFRAVCTNCDTSDTATIHVTFCYRTV